MSNRNNGVQNNELFISRIETTDTISQFMEKVNNNFSKLIENNGGPTGDKGDMGVQGAPTKPKVPIHVWKINEDYSTEISYGEDFEIIGYGDLADVKYQEGHLILLENAHVYKLEVDNTNSNFSLKPIFLIALQSYNQGDVVNGQNAYMHIAYADSPDGIDNFTTSQSLRGEVVEDETETVSTFSLRRNTQSSNSNASNSISHTASYMGIYSNNEKKSSENPYAYTWVPIQGATGPTGPKGDKGEKGDKGDGYTGHPYTIDLEGDMSTISIDVDRTRLYDDSEDYCKCIAHAYYGDKNVKLNFTDINSIKLPDEYKYSGDDIVLKSNSNSKVGKIIKEQSGNDVVFKFIPDENFIFPQKTIVFSIHIVSKINDTNDGKIYTFEKDVVWSIKPIMSTFELEIIPQHYTIKLDENGTYSPDVLSVNVYKIEDSVRTEFDFSQNPEFKLLYKNNNTNTWSNYPNGGVRTNGVSCLEFKVVRYFGLENEEIWDYEDVWVVADGKSSHYYHADLGTTESMMVLTTGRKINVGKDKNPKYCVELRNTDGYSITFNPKFYDGTTELEVKNINIGQGDEVYYENGEGLFQRELQNNTLTITQVPYGVEMIPMNINVVTTDGKSDSVAFNVYISSLSNTYTLTPSVSSYNTSTGKNGETIGCDVYKNNEKIEISELSLNGLSLEYSVHSGGTEGASSKQYTRPLIFGNDTNLNGHEFTASDVAIVFTLYYGGDEIVRSTVPLIKDGIDGRDGESWQYIFCRSSQYPFEETKFSNPADWTDNKPKDPTNELKGDNGKEDSNWYDDHQGVDSIYKYEYQSYRKWNPDTKEWGKYGEPTLYSNFSESGSGYSVLLSNPVAVIPVGNGENDWSVDENNTNQSDFTYVYLYNNTSDISSNANIDIDASIDDDIKKHFVISNSAHKITFHPVVDGKAFNFNSNTQYKLPIIVTYDSGEDNTDVFETTINWTLTPIKGLEDVEVFVDKRVVNTTISHKHTLKVGYYLISTNGTKKFVESQNHNDNKGGYNIILTDDIKKLLDTYIVSDWQNAEYNFVYDNGRNKNCFVVLVDSNKNIIDYINVTSVNDGTSAIHLELTQDYIALPCKPEGGGIHELYNVETKPISSRMMLYNGDKLIEYDESGQEPNIKYSFKINGNANTRINVDNDGKFTIPKEGVITGDTYIECIATYNGVDYHKTLFIDLEETPYELELSKNVLIRDANINEILDENLIVRVKYWMNGSWNYTKDGEVKAYAQNESHTLVIPLNDQITDKCDRTLTIINSNFKKNNKDTEIKISYYKNGKELSYETIGIINTGKDGEKGSAPSCISVEILGYSIDENAKTEEIGKWSTLDKLYPLTPGTPIYILNQYTWSDGSITKGITVTLAGANGNDGKSRVLYYLGSFETNKATLSGTTIKGILNDERCDYYVDKNGNAWRRINANTVEAEGYADGNNNTTLWEQSNDIGFIKAGAIHADMINVDSIVATSQIVTKLFAQDITAENLKVKSTNIEGKLSAEQIEVGSITIQHIADGVIPQVPDKLIGEDDVTDIISRTHINGNMITTGKISASLIDVNNLNVTTLNTKPNENIDKIEIKDNIFKIFSPTEYENVVELSTLITSDEIIGQTSINQLVDDDSNKITSLYDGYFSDNYFDMIESNPHIDDKFIYENKDEIEFSRVEVGFLNIGGTISTAFYLTIHTDTGGPYYLYRNEMMLIDGSCKIIVEKLNSTTNNWEECEDLTLNIKDYPDVTGNTTDLIHGIKIEKTITVHERGLYRCRAFLCKFYTSNNKKTLLFGLEGHIQINRNNEKSKYTMIGKNGAIFKTEGKSIFYISPNEIGMRVGKYGLKVKDDNIYIKYFESAASSWVTLEGYIKMIINKNK